MGTFRDTRSGGEERKIIFTTHSLDRVRQRLPRRHSLSRLGDSRLADCIEDAVLSALRFGRVVQLLCPSDLSVQWDVDIRKEIGYPLIIALKDKGSDGRSLGSARVAITALVGSDKYHKRRASKRVA